MADKSFRETVEELWDLLKAYAKQETIDPILRLKAYIAYGGAGSFLFAIGTLVFLLGVLRFIEAEGPRLTDVLGAGNWSWTPYLIVSIIAVVWLILFARRIPKQFEEQ